MYSYRDPPVWPGPQEPPVHLRLWLLLHGQHVTTSWREPKKLEPRGAMGFTQAEESASVT